MARRSLQIGLFAVLSAASLLVPAVPAFAQSTAAPAGDKAATPAASATPDTSSANSDTSPATTPAPVITSVDAKPGDKWVIDYTNDITGELARTATLILTEIQGQTFSVSASFVEASTGSTRPPNTSVMAFDNTWNIIDTGVWKYHPGDPTTGIKLPLKLGQQWKTTFSIDRQDPAVHWNGTATTSVTAWEHVTLSSGLAYDAFRLETNERQVSSGSPRRSNTLKVTLWYAPEVNHFVKRIEEDTVNGRLSSREVASLVDFTRRTDD